MEYKTKELEDKEVEITLKFTKEEWENALAEVYEKTKDKYDVQGFRKGHAPRQVIEKTYGNGIFDKDAKNDCFYKGYAEFMQKEKEFHPVSFPERCTFRIDDSGLELTFKVTVKPEVTLGKYKGLTVKMDKVSVSDEEVNAALEHLRQDRARFVEVDREAKKGDTLTIDFVGIVDGKKFEGGSAKDYDLELGSHSFIDTFEDQLIGVKKGDKKNVNVTFPDTYKDDLKGKPAVFEVTVKSVKEKQLPDLNDKFADEVSEVSTLSDLKEKLRDKLLKAKTTQERSKAEGKLIGMIVDASSVDIPEVMIADQLDSFINGLKRRLSYKGLTLDSYLNYAKTTLDDLKKARHEDARGAVKERLVLEEILLKEGIDVTEEEMQNKFNENAKEKRTLDQIRKSIGEEKYRYLQDSLLLNKLMDFLKKANKIE